MKVAGADRASRSDRSDQAAAFDAICARHDGAFRRKGGQLAAGPQLLTYPPLGAQAPEAEFRQSGPDDAEIPFLGHTFRVSAFLRGVPRPAVRAADFETTGEETYAYAPASTDAPPEHQLFLNCRRTGQ
ncbi:hypothetical protein ACIREE_01355 [Streptomyces sp. NPDC102467]|uniref:hypothetical protein n=1 Tax=Streptomyces sp. NPDC102467 TaxID=3366179 RepID=UPI00381EC02F